VGSIRAILFDADGVLQHATDDLEARLERVFGSMPDPIEEFVRDVFGAEALALTGEADFVEQLAPVAKRWGADGAAAELARCWSSIVPDHAILSLVAELRERGYHCSLATNQQRYRAEHMSNTLGYAQVFDRTFYSWEIGAQKPDRRYFDRIVAALPFSAEQMLFFDDREENVEAARATGINAAQFIHPRSAEALPLLREVLRSFAVKLE
jgi:putative hydrolase of the HAD superfamily